MFHDLLLCKVLKYSGSQNEGKCREEREELLFIKALLTLFFPPQYCMAFKRNVEILKCFLEQKKNIRHRHRYTHRYTHVPVHTCVVNVERGITQLPSFCI